ncbi:MAG: NAD(P)-dependent oxidoreductase [Synechococcales bacterium]|nr:NAD(P)-dependent oxidoreductase [Synechococcales bacterium]
MKCFVAGATGFVGHAVAKALVQKGFKVYGLTSQKSNVQALDEQKICPIYGDMRDPSTWQDHVKEADVVIHAAQLKHSARISPKTSHNIAETDFTFTQQILAHASRCQAFIYTSGAWIYGNCSSLKTEDSPLAPYAIAAYRLKSEGAVLEAASQIPTTILRLGMVYGNGGLFKKLTLDPMVSGQRVLIPGCGTQKVSLIHVEDCAQAYLACLDKPPSGKVINVCDSQPISFETVVNALVEQLSAKPAIKIPSWLFSLYVGQLTSRPVLGDTMIDNSKLIDEFKFNFKYPTYREGTRAIAQQLLQAT